MAITTGYLYEDLQVRIDSRAARIGGSWQGPKTTDGNPTAWGPGCLRWFHKEAQKFSAPVVLDIGANTGSYCLLAAHHPGMCVYAFEPTPSVFDLLEINVCLNKLTDRVKTYQMALSDYTGQGVMRVPIQPSHMGEAIFDGTPLRYHQWQDMQVPVSTLDDFCREQKMGRLNLIKIDTEGHELMALRGGAKIIQHFHPTILLEYYALNTRQHGYEPIVIRELLESWGYTCEMMGDQDLIATWNMKNIKDC